MPTRPVTAPPYPASASASEAGGLTPQAQAHEDEQAHRHAETVFLKGSQLPERWQGQTRFVVLATHWGLGHHFLATWQRWQQDPQRCDRLYFIAIAATPPSVHELLAAHHHSPCAPLATELAHAWPPLTPNLHRISLDGDRVQLLLILGEITHALAELSARVDAFFIDATSAATWHPRQYKALARLAGPAASLACTAAPSALHQGLRSVGFELIAHPAHGHVDDTNAPTLARYAPRFTPKPAPARTQAGAGPRHALVIGAGLAGSATAWALAQQGWHSTVIERHANPAQEASGNPAGLFHGIVNAQDGTHARFNRAASHEAHAAVQRAIKAHGVAGSAAGLLRLETQLPHALAMAHMLAQLGLPLDYVQALAAADAATRSGLPLSHPAWFYPRGGWVEPAGLVRAWLAQAALHTTLHMGVAAHRLQRTPEGWQVWGTQGQLVAQAPVVVVANAGDALRLLGDPGWPVRQLRGQLSHLPAACLPHVPALPVAGAGYVLPECNGRVAFGATSQENDDDAQVRDSDHAHNLVQLAQLMGASLKSAPWARIEEAQALGLAGRTAWRWSALDRLPLIGPVPIAQEPQNAQDAGGWNQPQHVPRQPGLFVFAALGSRGITWAALGGQVLAAQITGAPVPLENSLIDAIDPARFRVRALRRAAL